MEYVGIEAIRKEYAQDKINNGDYARGLEIYQKDMQTPTFEGLAIHPETEPVKETINNALRDISIDFVSLESELINTANNYASIINNMVLRLEAADQQIQVERDRIKDINAICGQYSEFSSVRSYNGNNVSGDYGWLSDSFTGGVADVTADDITITIEDVSGNGVDGNEYVKGSVGSKRTYLVDDDELTRWEYSRYTASSIPKGAPIPVNGDSEEARATVTMSASKEISAIKIKSDSDVVVEDVLVSYDGGLTFESTMSKEIHINNPDAKYNDPEYIYGSGIIAFPNTTHIKIRFRSNGVTNDVMLDAEGNELVDVKRHAIIVNGIQAYNAKYVSGELTTANMIASPVDCIAVFASEYVPRHYPEQDYFKYILTVNGIDYDVVPINSNRDGVKMIRFSDYTVNDSYIEHLKEPIKSATLKVLINPTPGGETPYLSNLKVCIGKVVS